MYFAGTAARKRDIKCWTVSLFCLHARKVPISIFLWMCFFIYFVEMEFSCIVHMVPSVDLLTAEDFSHARPDFLSMCGPSMVAKYWLCIFFSLVVLTFWFNRFVLMLVFSCCFVDFESIWSFYMHVSPFWWVDLIPLCAFQIDACIVSFSVYLCK